MDYKLIDPPLVFNHIREASLEEAQKLFEWFINNKDKRIHILEEAIQTTPTFENWKADLSVESLEALSEWLKNVIKTRKMTQDEVKKEKDKLKPPYDTLLIPDETTLNVESISIAFDSGTYFGEVLKKAKPNLKWELFQKKGFYESNQPVLIGEGKLVYNPRNVFEAQAFRAIRGVINLVELFKNWQKLLK